MRVWLLGYHTLRASLENNPLQFLDLVMSLSAVIWLTVWLIEPYWPFLVLGSSYAIGLALMVLVREGIAPSPQAKLIRIRALLLLGLGLFSFADIAYYL